MKAMFEALGALCVDGGPTLNPPTKDILAGIESCVADEVLVLPNSRNVTMAAEEAVRLAATAGRTAIVVPSEFQQAGLAVMVEFDPAASAEENAERLGAGLAGIRVGAVAPAARDDADGRFRRGDSVGFAGDEIVAWGGAGSTLVETVARARRRRRDRHRDRGRGGSVADRASSASPSRTAPSWSCTAAGRRTTPG